MYNTVIFDLDDTLTDDFENCKQAFKIMIASRNEEYKEENFLKFNRIDKKTWADRAKGILKTPYENNKDKMIEWLRASRIINYYDKENITYDEAVKLNEIYMNGMKDKIVSRPNVKSVMEYLHNKGYKIIIATNGPIIPLEEKIKKLEIYSLINLFFSAEEVGVMKPNIIYYNALFNKAEIDSKENVLIIGDGLDTDIKGGIEFGIDTCWCNYKNEINTEYNINYEIHELKELIKIL